MSKDRGFRARALGEIAIRCVDMNAMVAFYETVIGLERLHGDYNSEIVFFCIAEGFGGPCFTTLSYYAPVCIRQVRPGPSQALAQRCIT
jgi:catechol 2,3-dioxygenase-like lactoylglutathione lyase family enzyme